MILSDKSPTRPKPAMAAPTADASLAKPVPKTLCASCGRPIALLTAATCVYCGAAQASPVAPREGSSKIPAQVLVMLEPRLHERKRGRVWLFRAGAAVIGILFAAMLIGPCMRMPTAP